MCPERHRSYIVDQQGPGLSEVCVCFPLASRKIIVDLILDVEFIAIIRGLPVDAASRTTLDARVFIFRPDPFYFLSL